MIDHTHAPKLKSWVTSANGHPVFPIQNLPLGAFSDASDRRRLGVAIGDAILDLDAALGERLLTGDAARAVECCAGGSLNELMAMGKSARRELRRAVSELLSAETTSGAKACAVAESILLPAKHCEMHVPAMIGGFSDFYAGIHHARRVGKLFRPDSPLTPNYKHVPIAYNSRASTVGVAPATVRRPVGQVILADSQAPAVAASSKLDYELELGIWVGPGNPDGEPIDIARAGDSVFGFCILNDWSARDLQRWEAQPLGPFLSKSFATTISPWIVTPEALEPFRVPQAQRPDGDPAPLPYLWDDADQSRGALAIDLEILLRTPQMQAARLPGETICRTSTVNLYWTPAQLVAHHSMNGCILSAGDILGTGTISGMPADEAGCLLEQTLDGSAPITLTSGETRTYLEDGDEVTLRARCVRAGCVQIGFGDNVGTIA